MALDAGENALAYNVGLTDHSRASIPLIASGFSETVGVYSRDPLKFGGVWHGARAVVIYCDGSGEIARLNAEGKYIRDGRNVFAAGPTMNFVNPKPPKAAAPAAEEPPAKAE